MKSQFQRNLTRAVRNASICSAVLLTIGYASMPAYAAPSKANQDQLNDKLTMAVRQGNVAAVKELLAQGADVNSRDWSGGTSLMDSETYYDILHPHRPMHAIPALLLKAHADPNVVDDVGCTALMLASDAYEVRQLIAYGARINLQNKKGETALWYNCCTDGDEGVSCNNDIAIALIDAGADVNLPSHDGRTPLIALCQVVSNFDRDALQIAKDLVRHGADVSARDHAGHTALYYAKVNHLTRVTRYLKNLKHTAQRS